METLYQKEYFLQNFKKTAVRHLYDLGFWRQGTSCAHSVWLTREDIDILADAGVVVVNNVSSNLRLKSGIAPVRIMLDRGIEVALGMDGTSLNDDNDMFQEMRLSGNLHNQPGIGMARLSPGQVFGFVSKGGAKATTFGDDIGSLEKGKKADVVLMRHDPITSPCLSPELSLRDALFYRGKGVHVDTVIVDGITVMEHGAFTGVSRDSVVQELCSIVSGVPKAELLRRREVIERLVPYVKDLYGKMKPRMTKPFYVFNSNDEN
jgi:cytosine/adenosine deaminase-related metal-dependent hydrolase